MERAFWHERWALEEIGFHEGEPNHLLVKHFARMNLHTGGRVFLPLCGKTRDFAWLFEQGYRAVGAELSERAIEQLFAELRMRPEISIDGALKVYRSGAVEVFVGDLFDLTAEQLGPVGAIYDRAALVALPASMRERYAAHLTEITAAAPQFLVTFEYDQTQMEGPPFSLTAGEIRQLYAETYRIETAEMRVVPGLLKGQVEAHETARLLQTRN